VYPEPHLVDAARRAADSSPRCEAVSVHFDWSWDKWPADPHGELAAMAARGVDRAFVAIGADDTTARISTLSGFDAA